MPKLAIRTLWVGVVLYAGLNVLQGIGAGLFTLIFSGIIAMMFQWYLTSSKRVNLTYHHQVPA